MVYVANWKMNINSLDQALFLCHEIAQLPAHVQENIIVCPSFIHIYSVMHHIPDMHFSVGAQTCSEHVSGAFTGQVSALQLKNMDVTYCIIGHSEQRMYNHETPSKTAIKIEQLLAHNITPIICIGETESEHNKQQTVAVLEDQLKPIVAMLKNAKMIPEKLYFAYEPVWAIGTGNIPDNHLISSVFGHIKEIIQQGSSIKELVLLYGGSVDQISAQTIRKIPGLSGFLIGGASTDFQKFKNIVLLK